MRKQYTISDTRQHDISPDARLRFGGNGPRNVPGRAHGAMELDRADIAARVQPLLILSGYTWAMLPFAMGTRAGRRAILGSVYAAALDSARATLGMPVKAARFAARRHVRSLSRAILRARAEYRQGESYARSHRLGARRDTRPEGIPGGYIPAAPVASVPAACPAFGSWDGEERTTIVRPAHIGMDGEAVPAVTIRRKPICHVGGRFATDTDIYNTITDDNGSHVS